MTTTIKVTSHNYPALVETLDTTIVDGMPVTRLTYEKIIFPENGEVTMYCTTSRELRIKDLDYNDPAVLAEKEKQQLTK